MDYQTAKLRGDLMNDIRSFFRERGVLEVETPILSQGSGLDPYIDIFETENFIDGLSGASRKTLYLNSSPEFHMKRLLSQGYGDIFQIAKAFRNGETGKRHQWEFSILEWYRLGWTAEQLRDEVIELVRLFGFQGAVKTWKWRELYIEKLKFDPLNTGPKHLEKVCLEYSLSPLEFTASDRLEDKVEAYLDYLLVSVIEPQLGWQGPEWIVDYPAHQAALAKTWQDEEGNSWAYRFELYIEGVELCNGYWELTDAREQAARFNEDQAKRVQLNKRTLTQDEEFLEALKQGLPECSGVALGLDRLIMLKLNKDDISEVITFHNGNC